jgi:hypothetical protein
MHNGQTIEELVKLVDRVGRWDFRCKRRRALPGTRIPWDGDGTILPMYSPGRDESSFVFGARHIWTARAGAPATAQPAITTGFRLGLR